MKIRFAIPILIITLFFSSCISNNVKKEIIKNPKIKSCLEFTYDPSGIHDDAKHKTIYDEDNKTLKTIVMNSDGSIRNINNFIYNKDLLIEKVSYESDGKTIDSKEIYSYENENMIERKLYSVNSNGELYFVGGDTYKYDKEGRKIEENQGKIIKYVYKYGNYKLLERTSYFYGNKPDTSIHIYKYDEAGKLIQDFNTSPAGKIFFKSIFKYDEFDRLISEDGYNPNGKMISQYKLKYDEYGNIIEKIEFHFNSNKKLTTNFIYEFYN